jgi:hypothetical protein
VSRLLLGLGLLALSACRLDEAAAARLIAEKRLLESQIAGLEQLIAAAEQKTLLGPQQLLVGADEATIQRLIAASLPQELVLAKQFRVRLLSAEARFRDSQGLVVLRGRASPLSAADTFVDVRLLGGLNDVAVRHDTGTLAARVAVYHLEVERAAAAGSEGAAIRALAEALGRERLDALSELVPPVEIPIRLEESLALEGFEEGPLSVPPGSLPMRVSVARVVALAGRLWVVLDVGAGPWSAGRRAGP